ncbi:hypothetical protein CXG81DRAFT_23206 [Caulochytrium protostelioides]|uniref:ER membrane protein complex subunit 10 n=1 Tax=Caulochytrium protostelioides TaxID=1555241 RepID=A0A4P9XFB2_9FUNG|nr:hypothetical protein CXG81DRAFT_23206 [Caulochytrium protostelioides]|eukprot:RKP04254.1 hypothetical protein CXG81DRAFT_23206 [Caulochytrium protostelioides]
MLSRSSPRRPPMHLAAAVVLVLAALLAVLAPKLAAAQRQAHVPLSDESSSGSGAGAGWGAASHRRGGADGDLDDAAVHGHGGGGQATDVIPELTSRVYAVHHWLTDRATGRRASDETVRGTVSYVPLSLRKKNGHFVAAHDAAWPAVWPNATHAAQLVYHVAMVYQGDGRGDEGGASAAAAGGATAGRAAASGEAAAAASPVLRAAETDEAFTAFVPYCLVHHADATKHHFHLVADASGTLKQLQFRTTALTCQDGGLPREGAEPWGAVAPAASASAGGRPAAKPAKPLKVRPLARIKGAVTVQRFGLGARPALDQIVESTPDGRPEPPKSFLAKYWVYLVPLLVMMLIGGGAPEEEAASGSGTANRGGRNKRS